VNTSPLRFILAITIGVFVAYCVDIFFLSYAPNILGYAALKEGTSREEYIQYLHKLPLIGVTAIILICGLGAFSGGYVASRIEKIRKQDAALGVGIFSLIILVFMSVAFSFPYLLAIGLVIVQIPMAILGARILQKN
jgi:MFS family permease